MQKSYFFSMLKPRRGRVAVLLYCCLLWTKCFPAWAQLSSPNPFPPPSTSDAPYFSPSPTSPPVWRPPQSLMFSQSQIPGVLCPLMDGRPRMDLVRASQSLVSQLNPVKACTNNTSSAQIEKTAQAMAQSSQRVMDLFKMFQSGQLEPLHMQEAQSDLGNIMQGIDQISDLFRTNSLLNEACGPGTLKSTSVIAALGDLVQAISPFVVSMASLNPTWAATAAPYLVGMKGAGSVLQALRAQHEKNRIDLSESSARQAVLVGICEHYRLWTKTKTYLNLRNPHATPQGLSTPSTSQNLQSFRLQLQQSLPLEVARLASAQDEKLRDLQTQISRLSELQKSFSDFFSRTQKSDAHFVCTLSRELAKNALVHGSLSSDTLTLFQSLLQWQFRPSELQLALIKNERNLRQSLLSPQDTQSCANSGRSYLMNFSEILQVGQKTALNLTLQIQEINESNPALKELQQLDRLVQYETASDQILENAARQGVLDDAEIYSALRESKRALFQPRSGSSSWRKPLDFLESEGPALAWLNWSDQELRRHEAQFSRAMQKLKFDVYRDVVLVQNPDLVKDPKTGKVREQFRPSDLYRSARVLQYLDASKFRPGSSAQLKICTRLTNIWLNWQATTSHLASQAFFCGLIEELILGDEFSIQSGIRDRCGRTKITGEPSERSGLSIKSRQIHQEFHLDVTAIGKKIRELKCVESKASSNP